VLYPAAPISKSILQAALLDYPAPS
jgi:hypothetical protein